MQRVARIALGVAVSNGKSGSYQQSSIDELTQDITTFLLLLGLDAITPEHITLIGRPATGAMDAWFEEWNFDHVSGVWTASLLKRYQDLFIVLLECYIQHLQLASKLMVIGVSGYFAHFLINTLVALKDDVVNEQLQQEQEEAQPNKSLSIAATTLSILSTQPIPARMQKLVSYFLHFDNAIQVFATAPIYLNDVIWVPTIRNAFHGLTLFAADDNDVDMDMVEVGPPLLVQLQQENQRNKQQENQDTILYKAKRAFSVLRAVTKFSNACAKLEQAGALHMVNIKYIPNSEVLETSVSVLNVYASFTHFIAALASTMALIRAKLRSDDAFPIGPAIMKLLWQATIRIHECQEKNLRNAWTHVVSGSLMVINAFEFDNESLQKWLAWPVHFTDCDGDNDSVITEVNSRGWIHSLRTNNGRLSVLPTILQALLPGRQSSDRYEILQDRISNSDYLGMLLHAVNAFNLLSTVPECGVQLVRDAEAMEFLCELLKGLLEQTKNSNYSPRLKAKSGEDIKMEVQTGADSGNEVNRISSILDSNNDNNSSSSSSDSERLTTSFTRSLSNRCYELLHRGLVRILASQENMRFIITSDVLTAFFKPLRTSIAEMDDYKLELSQTLCQDFYEERFEDFARLFQFTVGDDNATRLHELCAVATAYACPYPSHWDTVLGIRVVDGEEIIHNKSVFGALCRMLMFELLEQDSDNVYEAPYRRPAAAQAIEVLTQVLTPAWVADRQDIVVQLRDRISSSVEKEEDLDDSWRTNNDEHSEDMVAFTTEHSSIPITAKRGPLVRQSTFFAALFSGEYAENPDKTVKLLDITDHALTLFLDVINNIQLGEMRLSSSTCWRDVIDLLLAADRFGSTSVQSVCEEWISRSLVDQGNQGRLNGAILLFRRCRNPGAVDGGMALDVWPFQKVLKQALMIVVSELSVSCQATEFDNMLRDNDEDELSAFCQGMAVLICSTLDKM
ncbi:hypothetical protein BDB00DRAFT_102579 [Zychaea mexicana]|uniref:uncharacterized protein n=1 Tax=Zychaea mexicana TaxID=64656 RepID=UPI0022FEEB67|nr:uncharacterized protein BDB00DRAFT_102579 [Zychaea mexicana]KAI9496671.1 hypothetical protein BDB00DRAFT_102579 [Zychaea mexicana]